MQKLLPSFIFVSLMSTASATTPASAELAASGAMARASYPIIIDKVFIKPAKSIALCVVGCGIAIPLNATNNDLRAALIGTGVIAGWIHIWQN